MSTNLFGGWGASLQQQSYNLGQQLAGGGSRNLPDYSGNLTRQSKNVNKNIDNKSKPWAGGNSPPRGKTPPPPPRFRPPPIPPPAAGGGGFGFGGILGLGAIGWGISELIFTRPVADGTLPAWLEPPSQQEISPAVSKDWYGGQLVGISYKMLYRADGSVFSSSQPQGFVPPFQSVRLLVNGVYYVDQPYSGDRFRIVVEVKDSSNTWKFWLLRTGASYFRVLGFEPNNGAPPPEEDIPPPEKEPVISEASGSFVPPELDVVYIPTSPDLITRLPRIPKFKREPLSLNPESFKQLVEGRTPLIIGEPEPTTTPKPPPPPETEEQKESEAEKSRSRVKRGFNESGLLVTNRPSALSTDKDLGELLIQKERLNLTPKTASPPPSIKQTEETTEEQTYREQITELLIEQKLRLTEIFEQTTPETQITTTKTGVCEESQPDGCIANAVKENSPQDTGGDNGFVEDLLDLLDKLGDGNLEGEEVEEEEIEAEEIKWVLVDIVRTPHKGKVILHSSPANNDYFAGYLSWMIKAKSGKYHLPQVPIRKKKTAIQAPIGAVGYNMYAVNGASLRAKVYIQKVEVQ